VHEDLKEPYKPGKFGSEYYFRQMARCEMSPFGFLFEPDGSRTRVCTARGNADLSTSPHPTGFVWGTAF
jgi:hypothetical protein